MLKSTRPSQLALFQGFGAIVTTELVGLVGISWFRMVLAAGLMQPGLMILFATQGAPELALKGAPVKGSVGLRRLVVSARKSPVLWAAVGTKVTVDPESWRCHRR